jgi:NAD+ kinase
MRSDFQRDKPVGIVANPASARDIRRLIASASGIQLADRANIVQRVLAGLGAAGVERAVMMPDGAGIGTLLRRSLLRRQTTPNSGWPEVDFIDMPLEGTVDDTLRAVGRMVELDAAAIVVLGGDGTHRAVASRCGGIPIAGLSTGTNNVFPEFREPTITGLATGLVATGVIARSEACRSNKVLRVTVNDGKPTLALVDVCVTRERFLGARALWKPESLTELFVTFAEPEAIGLSAIAGLLKPVGRDEQDGLRVETEPIEGAATRVWAPIAPGLVVPVGIAGHSALKPGEMHRVKTANGALALDGEREIEFNAADEIRVWLECGGLDTIDVARVMALAAERGIMTNAPGTRHRHRAPGR